MYNSAEAGKQKINTIQKYALQKICTSCVTLQVFACVYMWVDRLYSFCAPLCMCVCLWILQNLLVFDKIQLFLSYSDFNFAKISTWTLHHSFHQHQNILNAAFSNYFCVTVALKTMYYYHLLVIDHFIQKSSAECGTRLFLMTLE